VNPLVLLLIGACSDSQSEYGIRGDPSGRPYGLGVGIGIGARQWYNCRQSHSNLDNVAGSHSRDGNALEWAAIVAYYNTRLVLRSMTAWFLLVSSKIAPCRRERETQVG